MSLNTPDGLSRGSGFWRARSTAQRMWLDIRSAHSLDCQQTSADYAHRWALTCAAAAAPVLSGMWNPSPKRQNVSVLAPKGTGKDTVVEYNIVFSLIAQIQHFRISSRWCCFVVHLVFRSKADG